MPERGSIMANSQNGWPVYTSAPSGRCKWITGRVAPGDVETVFNYLGERFNSEVEKITVGHSWGWANRPIRGSSSTSNHASGTAVDLNAPKHPLGKSGTFSAAQFKAIRKILNDLGGAIRFGGDYSGRKDEMHFEVNTSKANLAKVAASIRKGEKPKPVGGATGGGNTYTAISGSAPLVKLYHKGEPVKRIQKAVGVKADGYYGPSTVSAVKAWQKANGLDVDGLFGEESWAKLNGGSKKPATPKVPAFPLLSGHWYGPESRNPKNHSGFYAKDRTGIKQFQSKLKSRGWTITPDGRFGSQTSKVVKQFQDEKGLTVDGGVGATTWAAIWSEPVT